MEQTRHLDAAAQILDALVIIRRAGAGLSHGLDVAPGAEGAPGTSEDDHTDLPIGRRPRQGRLEKLEKLRRESVQALRPVHREGEDAVLQRFQQDPFHGVPRHSAAEAAAGASTSTVSNSAGSVISRSSRSSECASSAWRMPGG
jgi:hypothetical protein